MNPSILERRAGVAMFLWGSLGLAGASAFVACGDDSDSSSGGGGSGGGATTDASTTTTTTGGAGGASTTSGSGGDATGAGGGTSAACANDPSTADNTAAVVAAAQAFLETLSADEQDAVLYDHTLTHAAQWSNFPTTFVQRNGLKLEDLSEEAQSAAVALAQAAGGEAGATLLDELREADEFLVTDANASSTDYGRGLYYFSIHGTPSTTEPWMLQIAGHHLALNTTYNGACTSATPLFDGVEPTTWTDDEGIDHAPLEAQRAAMVTLLEAVGDLDGAQLSGSFNDLVNGPAGGGPNGSGGDTKFPAEISYPTGTSGRGVSVATLSDDERQLVKTAIEAWVGNVAEPVAASLLEAYESDEALDETYVGYTGSTDLTTQSSYVRIDGPRVWIEVTIQGGIVYQNRVHYHTIWRDKVADYGAEFGTP